MLSILILHDTACEFVSHGEFHSCVFGPMLILPNKYIFSPYVYLYFLLFLNISNNTYYYFFPLNKENKNTNMNTSDI